MLALPDRGHYQKPSWPKQDHILLPQHILRVLSSIAFLLASFAAQAVEPVRLLPSTTVIDLLRQVEFHRTDGDAIQISTAPGTDGIVRRMAISAKENGTNPDWIVFALKNDSEETITRWLVAPHFYMIGSGILLPDLGATRITAVTSSAGEPPERIDSAEADIFEITLEAGAVVTYVAERASPLLPQLALWAPDSYKDRLSRLTLYHGMVIGISGLLALILTIAIVIRGALIFPAAAALAWSVLAYISVDFGFLAQLLKLTPEAERIYRAGSEVALAATLVVFLFAYLNLNRWHVRYGQFTLGWVGLLLALIFLAWYNPALVAGIARFSIGAIAVIGFVLIVYLSTHGYDRAVLLIPTWLLLLIWVSGIGFILMGRLQDELAPVIAVGVIVILVMLVGFTVMQHAFSSGVLSHALVSESERKALALNGSGDSVFDWDVVSDKVTVGIEIETALSMTEGELSGPAARWVDLLHPFDRDRFRATLDAALEQARGRIQLDFRLQGNDGHYLWFQLKSRPLVAEDGSVIRIVGTLTETTGSKLAEQRILKDAVRDHLTGLPNERLFIDRVTHLLSLTRGGENIRSTVMMVDLDRFRSLNERMGVAGGDTILLTMARRIGRLLRPQDTLARLGADRFAILLLSEREPGPITAFSDAVRKTIAAPVNYGDKEISLTASIGIALPDPNAETGPDDLLRNAEIAMTHAKRLGGDRIDVFRPAMRAHRTDRAAVESDFQQAVATNAISVRFVPMVRLEDRSIIGFEAVPRWDAPSYDTLAPGEILDIAAENGFANELTQIVLEQATHELSLWQEALEVEPPIFATVNISGRQLIEHDLVQDIKAILARHSVRRGSLRLEITENGVMDNPEYASRVLNRLAENGIGLILDDFGTGYSSLSYLQRFPFDIMKISRVLLREDASGQRPAILRAVVALAQDLNMTVVADGLDQESDAEALRSVGCEFGQGYIIGPPMTAAQTRSLLGVAEKS